MGKIKLLANVCLLIALYYFVYFTYTGIRQPIPALGDSWDYHIPIAQTILDGRFLNPSNFVLAQWYYPGSSEAIISLFIFFHIPLTLSNIFAVIVLFFGLWKLGGIFKLRYYYALIFSLTFITLNVVVRWLNAVSIDVWVGVFFVLAIILLENPKKSLLYFAKLGFVSGMLIGSKYTAFLFAVVLLGFYIKSTIKVVNLPRILVFIVPFSIFGLFWYVRNYLLMHNPFYPLEIWGFKGKLLFTDRVWNIFLKHPLQMFDSAFSEYKIWSFVVLIALGWLAYQYLIKKHYYLDSIKKLFLLGLINLLFYFTFPTSEQPWIMVSSLRYSLPVFIPLILGVFLLAAKYKKEEVIGYIAIGNMIMVVSLAYHPKLVLLYLPLAIIIFYFMDRYEKKNFTKMS